MKLSERMKQYAIAKEHDTQNEIVQQWADEAAKLEDETRELWTEAQRAFVVLEETPEPAWEDERAINNRIQEAHDILDTVLMKYFREP